MFEYLQRLPGVPSYCCLYHHAGCNKIPQPINPPALSPSKLVNEVVCHDKQTTKEIELATEEHPDLAQHVETHRVSLDLCNTQELIIASVWVIMDVTADTNKESRPLFTITGKDLTGHMFTILRSFVPNERAWVFRWLFQTVMPALLGKDFLVYV